MKKSLWILAIMFLVNIPSMYYGWYLRWGWFDTIQHFLGGFFVAMLMYYYLKEHLKEGAHIKNILIIVGASIFIGVVWEFTEYVANQILVEPIYRYFGVRGYFMGDIDDTIKDLLMDTSGAILFYLLHLTWKKKELNSF